MIPTDNVRISAQTLENEVEDTTLIGEGELPCVIIYSDNIHVSYINTVVDQIQDDLEKAYNFKVNRLGAEVGSGQDYLIKLKELIDSCVLGVIILDGLRPNVVFEFGFLLGKQKPFIVLQSKHATVSIKGLYGRQAECGLGADQFAHLLEPKLEIKNVLSDFAGKHLSEFDWTVARTDSLHAISILNREIRKIKSEIQEETRNVKTKGMKGDVLKEILVPLNRIITIYNVVTIDKNPMSINVDDLRKAHEEIANISRQLTPSQTFNDIYKMIAATYMAKAEEMWQYDVETSLTCAQFARELYQDILNDSSLKPDSIEFANIQKKVAYVLYFLAKNYADKDKRTLLIEESIQAYDAVLAVYKSPGEHMRIVISKGVLFNELGNYHASIECYNRAIEIDPNYASAWNNKGNSLRDLGRNDEAIECYNRAIEIDPNYASAWNNKHIFRSNWDRLEKAELYR